MKKTLLIMAAGMGSRFGGLKQATPFGPNGEFIIDYSIYDAIKCGINKVVFIIKEENYVLFRDTVGKRIEDKVEVHYVFQNLDNVPSKYEIPSDRVKPLGTAHAILCAKDVINEPFVVINSDDFYGRDAYLKISKFLDEEHDGSKEQFGLVGYDVINTLTENGSVKRGVCEINNNKLVGLTESKIEDIDGIIKCETLSDGRTFTIEKDTKVSMNMFAFNPSIFKYLEEKFIYFLEHNNLLKDEYLIPDVLSTGVSEGYCDVTIIPTTAKWAGVTYKEDTNSVINFINNLIEKGEYKYNLWD